MNDRQRLEAIVAVVCRYLPPDGITREQAMNEIIGLVDPLPDEEKQDPIYTQPTKIFGPNLEEILNSAGFYRKAEWQGLTDEEIDKLWDEHCSTPWSELVSAIEAKLKERNV